ncbi:MAG TPA: Hsp20/alpha crystallin family protein [Streptosporangiaceae bacterium]
MLLTDPFLRDFDRVTSRMLAGTGTAAVMPMDGVRRENDVLLTFDVPGVDPESVEVTVDGRVLTVSAKRADPYDKDTNLIVRERPTGSFTRRVHLSEDLDGDHVEARYTDGVLAVRIPLAETAKPRKIEIQRGATAELTA